jgi:thiol-disulfide isomerase/thioredoxin
MILKKLFLPLIFAGILSTTGSAFTGYRIEVKVDGLKDTVSYLAYYFGERQFLQDTANVDSHGHFIFEGHERLKPGMHMIVLPRNTYFEIIVDSNQHFSLSTSKENLIANLKFSNSPENTAFYKYIDTMQGINKELTNLRDKLQNESLTQEERIRLQERISDLENEPVRVQDAFISSDPHGLFSQLLIAQRSPDISDVVDNNDNTPKGSDLAYHTYKNRFWDNVNFNDERILRTPVYHSMLVRYFNHFLIQVPDTILAAADKLIEKCRYNDEFFRYTLWFITNNAERSQIMGMDAVFVHMVENYYNTGQAYWMTPEGLERLKKRAGQLAPTLIGKKAPDIRTLDIDGNSISMHDIDSKYLVVYFWESECGHCKKETPILKDIYEKYHQKGLEVFALNVESDQNKWKESVNTYELQWINASDPVNRSGFRDNYDVYAIPLLLLLDKDKKIIAKKISADQLDGFMQFQLQNRTGNNN